MASRLIWYGDSILSKMRAAQKIGIEQTMAGCVTVAKVKVRFRTGVLQGSLRFAAAKIISNGVSGTWGSFDVNYALWQEIGTRKMSAQPYLRPAADQEYPMLASRIRAAFEAIA